MRTYPTVLLSAVVATTLVVVPDHSNAQSRPQVTSSGLRPPAAKQTTLPEQPAKKAQPV